MWKKEVEIVCYVDVVLIFAETEDNQQKLLSLFNIKVKTLNMMISTEKIQLQKNH